MERPQITRVTLLVPGTPRSARAWGAALRPHGLRLADGALRSDEGEVVPAEWIENDGRFGEAFSFGTVDAKGVAAIDAVPGALVVSAQVDLREGRARLVALVERLRAAGALAVRLEQSKAGWEVDRWLELFGGDDPRAWHRAAVVYLSGDGALQSCGMHAFSLPDVRVEVKRRADAAALQELASALNVYQLAEEPDLRSGDTFSPDAETPRRLMERWPDREYPEDHVCHNPYGVWRLGPPGGRARQRGDLVPVFVPGLRLLLAALEQKEGRKLRRAEVEAARDAATCVTMAPARARALEQSRGWADLDPELAWEQWKLVREE
jgi:hypothetical protein